MAKQNYLKLAVVIVLTMAATSTVYAATTTLTGTTSIGGSSFSPSNKVSCFYESDGTATNAFDGTHYGIACGHLQGDKIIAAKDGDAKLYFATTTVGSATVGASSINHTTDLTATGTWTSM